MKNEGKIYKYRGTHIHLLRAIAFFKKYCLDQNINHKSFDNPRKKTEINNHRKAICYIMDQKRYRADAIGMVVNRHRSTVLHHIKDAKGLVKMKYNCPELELIKKYEKV